ncbi:hypothetical protein N9404_00355 [Candidatus Pelagibacter sp.]|nr:hypothetical protein [Candidatus Pelagibacter sp.]
MKNKLLLLETEMLGPGGHYLDNVIESYYYFRNNLQIQCLLNKKFNPQGTFIPSELQLIKILNSNIFKKEKNKFLYLLFEIFSLLKRFIFTILLIPFFLFHKNFKNYLNAIISNKFIIPKYFTEVFFFLKKNKYSKNDHIFFQTTRNKHIALANFIARIDDNLPNIHLRILYTPSSKKKFTGFYYYLNQIKPYLSNRKISLYSLTDKNIKIFNEKINSKIGIFKTNIPWVFFNREKKDNSITVGYMGDARESRGFNLLPDLIKKLIDKNENLNFLIQFSKTSSNSTSITSENLFKIAENNPKIKILKTYLDYADFRNTLQKIDIMPILHNNEEINNGNPSTIYSSITHEIPMVLPQNLNYMKEVMVNKSFEIADNLDGVVTQTLKIANDYNSYLNAAKINSKLLFEIFENDPLKKNIN